jgi:RNA polymerase sigma-70 factor, ECF subfamily
MDDKLDSWDRYLPYLRVVAERATRRSDLAGLDPSSIAQTAVTEAWKCRGNFRGSGDELFLAWMRGILANVMRTAVRKQIRRPVSVDMNDLDSDLNRYGNRIVVFANSIVSPSDALQKKEHSLLLTETIARLEADYRAVLIERHFEERSFEEIAKTMGRSEPATRMLWVRALRALRKAITTRL